MQPSRYISTLPPVPAFLLANQAPRQARPSDSIALAAKDGQTVSARAARIPLLVIEDHASLVDGMRAELAKDYAVTYVCKEDELRLALQEKSFSLAVVDLTLHQKLAGLEIMSRLKDAGIKFLVFSGTAEDWHILAAIRFGARGYVGKQQRLHFLRRALHTIANGDAVFPAEIIKKVRERKDYIFPTLGPAQINLIDILMSKTDPETNGIATNPFIAKLMHVTVNRVEGIFRSLYDKFNIAESSRAHLYAELKAIGYYPGVPLVPFSELGIKL